MATAYSSSWKQYNCPNVLAPSSISNRLMIPLDRKTRAPAPSLAYFAATTVKYEHVESIRDVYLI
jgi:hypothetical protein